MGSVELNDTFETQAAAAGMTDDVEAWEHHIVIDGWQWVGTDTDDACRLRGWAAATGEPVEGVTAGPCDLVGAAAGDVSIRPVVMATSPVVVGTIAVVLLILAGLAYGTYAWAVYLGVDIDREYIGKDYLREDYAERPLFASYLDESNGSGDLRRLAQRGVGTPDSIVSTSDGRRYTDLTRSMMYTGRDFAVDSLLMIAAGGAASVATTVTLLWVIQPGSTAILFWIVASLAGIVASVPLTAMATKIVTRRTTHRFRKNMYLVRSLIEDGKQDGWESIVWFGATGAITNRWLSTSNRIMTRHAAHVRMFNDMYRQCVDAYEKVQGQPSAWQTGLLCARALADTVETSGELIGAVRAVMDAPHIQSYTRRTGHGAAMRDIVRSTGTSS